MSRTSNQTQKLLDQLQHLEVNRSPLGAKANVSQTISLLEQITDKTEAVAVPVIAHFLFSSSIEVRRATCQALHRLITALPPIELLRLSSISNEYSLNWYMSPDWNALQPSNVSELAIDPSCRSALFGLLSFHRNGYVRHKAVHLLTECRNGSELPFLLIRQNDWVDPISSDAREAVQDRLNDDYLPHFVQNLPLVLHLRKFNRHDHFSIVNAVVQMLLRPERDARFVTVVRSSSSKVKREIFRVALALDCDQRPRVVRHGLGFDDALIRYWCIRQMRDCLPPDEWLPIILQLQNDRFMPVRREALSIETEIKPERSEAVWRQALLDSHASIRDLAQFHLRKTSSFKVTEFYRENIAVNGPTPAAVYGLGETGDSTDLSTIRAYLNASLPSQRTAAVRGLSSLGKEDVTSELVEYLCDPSPRVVREASRALIPRLHCVDGNRLLGIVEQSEYERSRKIALRLIYEKGKWDGLPWLIRAADHPDASVALDAQSFIAAWIFGNRVFTTPSSIQRQAIKDAISAKAGTLSKPFLEKLKGWLGAEYF